MKDTTGRTTSSTKHDFELNETHDEEETARANCFGRASVASSRLPSSLGVR
jgi:hypothetical protein